MSEAYARLEPTLTTRRPPRTRSNWPGSGSAPAGCDADNQYDDMISQFRFILHLQARTARPQHHLGTSPEPRRILSTIVQMPFVRVTRHSLLSVVNLTDGPGQFWSARVPGEIR